MSVSAVSGAASALRSRYGARRRPVLALVSACVAGAVLLPLVFLLIEAAQVGGAGLANLLFRPVTAQLLASTVALTAIVTGLCAVIGTAAAWATERTDLPARRALAVLLVLPVAIPDFVVASGWVSLWPSLSGLAGASLVMTLGLYPLVYLPVAAALRGADPAQEEVARSLGLGPLETLRRVTLRQVWPALIGGCLLVSLYLLAEYPAFAILRFQTFATEVFTELQVGFDLPLASALALVIVVLGMAVLGGESVVARASRWGRPPPRSRGLVRTRLGRATPPVLGGLGVLIALGVGVPVGAIVDWFVAWHRTTLPAASTLLDAAWNTAWYSASAALIATLAALPLAILAVRRRGPLAALLERSSLLVQALPGLVIALALVFFAIRYAPVAYQTAPLLVLAYAVMFFPRALISVRASVARVPPALEEVARSLGRRPLAVLVRVTLPLVVPGLLASFSLVFLTAITELTATLLLIPTGVQTLATQFWAYQTGLAYGAAAPFAAVMLGVAVVPSYVLGRWFDRSRSTVAA